MTRRTTTGGALTAGAGAASAAPSPLSRAGEATGGGTSYVDASEAAAAVDAVAAALKDAASEPRP